MKSLKSKGDGVIALPKQNTLFRVVHGIHALMVLLLLVTGLQAYNLLDQELGKIPSLFTLGTWISTPILWHIAFAWLFLLNGMGFLLYTLAGGNRKHFTDKDAQRLLNPVQNWQGWSYAIHRYLNTALGCLSALAGLSGLILLNWGGLGAWANFLGGTRFLRSLHLGLAPLFGVFLLGHIGLILRVGGVPLLLSAFFQSSPDEKGQSIKLITPYQRSPDE
jgi:thiosulfate reductase cytochrome b subunit